MWRIGKIVRAVKSLDQTKNRPWIVIALALWSLGGYAGIYIHSGEVFRSGATEQTIQQAGVMMYFWLTTSLLTQIALWFLLLYMLLTLARKGLLTWTMQKIRNFSEAEKR